MTYSVSKTKTTLSYFLKMSKCHKIFMHILTRLIFMSNLCTGTKIGILDGFIDHKQNMYPSNNECDIGKSICDKLFNKYKTHDFRWSNQSYTSIASSLYKHMCVYIPERTGGRNFKQTILTV